MFGKSTSTKVFLILMTIIYSLLMPFLVQVVAMSWQAFSTMAVSEWFSLFYVLTFYLVPVSVPVGLSIAWCYYPQGKSKKACWFALLPIGVLIASFAVSGLLDLVKIKLL